MLILMHRKIALITTKIIIADEIKLAFKTLYDVYIYKSSFALHYAMEQKIDFSAIISDNELPDTNGISLRKTLITLGYSQIPFIILLNEIKNTDRRLAMQKGIAEIFSKPLNKYALTVRIPYLIENYNCSNIPHTAAFSYKLPRTKRIFDVLFAGCAMIILSPIFLVIAILLKMESKGAILNFSLRAGLGYNVFKFYKFRTMYDDTVNKIKNNHRLSPFAFDSLNTDTTGGIVKELCKDCALAGTICLNPLYDDRKINCEKLYVQRRKNNSHSTFSKTKIDHGVSKVSGFICYMSLDKLPQLWNVFIGDLSIVGNRPLPLHEAEKITTDKYARRFIAPSGLTGNWRVEKRGELSDDERLDLDNNYPITYSFANDILLIIKSFPALFRTQMKNG